CKVVERGATVLDSIGEYQGDGLHQRFQLPWANVLSGAVRPNAGPEEDLIGIDVAQAGYEPLIEENRLDGGLPSPQEMPEILCRRQRFESVGTQRRHGIGG